jgi:hypothetical protein
MRERRVAAFQKFAKHIQAFIEPRFLVLTQRNVPLGQLGNGVDSLWEAFGRLRHLKLWAGVWAAFVSLEITFCEEGKTNPRTGKVYARTEWHPHLNVIFDGDYIPQAYLSKVWKRCTRGRGEITWIGKARNLGEVIKYVTKLGDIADCPEAVSEFLHATHKAKFIRTYGALYRLPENKEKKKPRVCPDCASEHVERIGPVSSVYYDRRGVLRFDVGSEWPQAPLIPMPREDLEHYWRCLEKKRVSGDVPSSAQGWLALKEFSPSASALAG